MITAEEFVRELVEGKKQRITKLGKVTSVSGGKTFIRFDGEDSASTKGYMKLSSYSPTVGDRVILLRCNGTYIILGKIG